MCDDDVMGRMCSVGSVDDDNVDHHGIDDYGEDGN